MSYEKPNQHSQLFTEKYSTFNRAFCTDCRYSTLDNQNENRYKVLFWISILILLATNVYWLYNTIDNAVGYNYYQVSCEEWQNDSHELKKLLPLDYDYSKMAQLIKSKGLKFDEFEKGDNKVVQFHSFDLVYGKTGELLEFNER